MDFFSFFFGGGSVFEMYIYFLNRLANNGEQQLVFKLFWGAKQGRKQKHVQLLFLSFWGGACCKLKKENMETHKGLKGEGCRVMPS